MKNETKKSMQAIEMYVRMIPNNRVVLIPNAAIKAIDDQEIAAKYTFIDPLKMAVDLASAIAKYWCEKFHPIIRITSVRRVPEGVQIESVDEHSSMAEISGWG